MLIIAIAAISLILFYLSIRRKKPVLLTKKHVVITGGSSGIGKAFAILIAKKGADVTIVARNKTNLEHALTEIKQACISESQSVQMLSLDVTNHAAVQESFDSMSPVDVLVNCAGTAICAKFEDTSVEDIQYMINTNYLGTVYPIKAVLKGMKERNRGSIIIVGSQASLVGIYGMSAYSASKFALRGLAESLDMEVVNYKINVTFAVPPDTDTPGFENENKNKPKETALICESGGLFKPEAVAEKLLNDSMDGKFFSYIGFESYVTATLCIGMTRAGTLFELVSQVFVLGPIRLFSYFYLLSFYKVIQKCASNK